MPQGKKQHQTLFTLWTGGKSKKREVKKRDMMMLKLPINRISLFRKITQGNVIMETGNHCRTIPLTAKVKQVNGPKEEIQMDADGSQSHPTLSEEPEGEQNGGMLTIRQTDDQERGLAVAILELIGSQPHIQVTETQSTENQDEDVGTQQVQVLQISQTEAPQGLSEDIHTQDASIVSVTDISESQKEAIHALETLVQIGHTGQHHSIGQLGEQQQADHVVIQFEPAHETAAEENDLSSKQSDQQEGSTNTNPNSATDTLCNTTLASEPSQRRIAVPPVTHTTASLRTRLKASRSIKKPVETDDTGDKDAAVKTSQPEVSKDGKEMEGSSPRTRQTEKLKGGKEEKKEDKLSQKKTPRKRSTGSKKSPGPRAKKEKFLASEETQNENPNSNEPNHTDAPVNGKDNVHVCPTCSQPFTRKDNLKVHMRKQHQEELEDKSVNKLTCFHPECGVSIYHTSKMIEHMEKEHGLVYQKEHLEFESFEEFKRWKDEEEAAKFIQFTSSSKEKLTGQGMKSLYYKCQRDGNDKPHRKKGLPGRKTERKAQKGSVKSNIWCPARISAKLNTKTGHVSVFYITSHSHPISYEDTKHHRLPELLRKEILGKFARGISIDEIYKDLHKPRDMDGNVSPLVNKQHHVSKRFLYMLRTKVTSAKKLHDDENTSVRLLVEHLKMESHNPVLMFKAAHESRLEGDGLASHVEHMKVIREDAYILALQTKEQLALLEKRGSKMICIDATHAVNAWGIQLVTLFVADEYQNGYPVAYLLTNHIDENILLGFMVAIKNKCPAFAPSLVVTDEDNTGLAQFEEIYGEGSFIHMLSKWHIHQAWLKQLKHHLPGLLLRQEVYHCLMLMLEERNVKKFEHMMNAFMCHYAEKCQIFTDYFQVTFASRPMKWASCYLTTSENTPERCVFQDSFHDKVKTFYTQKRKSNKRVDFLANILLEIAKNDSWYRNTRVFQELQKDASGTRFLTNHQRGVAIPTMNIKEEGEPDQLWKVTTESPKPECHEVKKLKEICDEEFCYQKCLELPCFSLCRHLYCCSCVEEAQICRHIHKIHMLRVAQVVQVPHHMQTDHLDLAANVELGCAETEVDDDNDDAEDRAQIENLKQQCQEMFSLLKDQRVRQLLLPHVCGTVSDLVATCEAVKAGAVTVTYEQPVEEPAAEQIVAIPIAISETQSQ